jgi:lipopolysaccharide biosynthesis regulator YciM
MVGWAMGRFGPVSRPKKVLKAENIFEDYFAGLNYLLNDEPDEAIDIFIKALEINSDTIESHLALGALLRRRGKVDKAIKVHQALLTRPSLEREFSDSVSLQLAQDYIALGLLDRAERLLNEILSEGSNAKWEALQYLITIYQTEKEWSKAVECSMVLLEHPNYKKDPQRRVCAAHYCCELAEQYLESEQESKARSEIKRAFTFERKHIRALLLLAEIEQRQGNYKAAIKELLRVRTIEPGFITQLLQPLARCYKNLDLEDEFEKLLREVAVEHSSAVPYLAELIKARSGSAAAIRFLSEHLVQYPSMEGLVELLGLQMHNVEADVAASLESLLALINEQVKQSFDYRCDYCGFEARSLFWFCPSCKKWEKIRFIRDK